MHKRENIIFDSAFKFNQSKKEEYFLKEIKKLTNFHLSNCVSYKKIFKKINLKLNLVNDINQVPFLPVNIFKLFDLMSIKKNKIVKKLVSSGTTGQQPSKIFLDKENSNNQMRVLTKIVEVLLGKKRLPMLIVDKKSTITNRSII